MQDFEEVYKEYYNQVYRYIYKLSRDTLLSEEITQETFFKVLKNIDSYKGQCKLSVWICQIAKNTFYDFCRKKHIMADAEPEYLGAHDNLEQSMVDKDMVQRIHEILHHIPEPYKEVFWMRTFGELPFAEIGRLHQKSDGWARVTYYRAKMMIKEELG